MRILLINPPTFNQIQSEVPSFLSEERGKNPPLGLMYIASSLEKYTKHEVKIIDSQVEELSYLQLRQRIKKEAPNILGTSITSFTLIDGLKVLEIAKEINENVKTILGGPHCHIYPTQTINQENIDYLILGEGEQPMVDLVKSIGNGSKLNKVDNLVYKKKKKIVQNPWKGYVKDLDALPFPARWLTPIKKYTSLLAKRTPVTTFISSRGCPHRCLFCNRPHLGKVFRARSPKNVVNELEYCTYNKINEFLMYDDTFAVDRKRVIGICDEIISRKLDIGFDIRTRVSDVDEKLLVKLRKAGCERIHYGVESGVQEILNILRKGITLKQAEKAFRLTKKAGIDTLAYFLIGSPSETLETIQDSIDFAKKLDADYCHFSLLTPFPGTALYSMALNKGIIKEDVWLKYATQPSKNFIPPIYEDNLNREELLEQLEYAYKQFYTRPSYIFKKMMKIRSIDELKRKVHAGIKVIKL